MMRGFLLFTDKSTNFHFSRFVATMQSSAPSSEGSFREAIHVEPTGFASGERRGLALLALACLHLHPRPLFSFFVSLGFFRARAPSCTSSEGYFIFFASLPVASQVPVAKKVLIANC